MRLLPDKWTLIVTFTSPLHRSSAVTSCYDDRPWKAGCVPRQAFGRLEQRLAHFAQAVAFGHHRGQQGAAVEVVGVVHRLAPPGCVLSGSQPLEEHWSAISVDEELTSASITAV